MWDTWDTACGCCGLKSGKGRQHAARVTGARRLVCGAAALVQGCVPCMGPVALRKAPDGWPVSATLVVPGLCMFAPPPEGHGHGRRGRSRMHACLLRGLRAAKERRPELATPATPAPAPSQHRTSLSQSRQAPALPIAPRRAPRPVPALRCFGALPNSADRPPAPSVPISAARPPGQPAMPPVVPVGSEDGGAPVSTRAGEASRSSGGDRSRKPVRAVSVKRVKSTRQSAHQPAVGESAAAGAASSVGGGAPPSATPAPPLDVEAGAAAQAPNEPAASTSHGTLCEP
jgi:hypothetical protein